jgi:iron complex outermembrane receptor protein
MSLRPAIGVALALLLSSPWLAQAQDEAAPPPEPAGVELPIEPTPPPQVETIEITAERENSADVQDEAQAITAFSAADLERANIVNIDSLAFGVPGLHVGQSGQEAIVTLRGIGTENASITGEPGVAFHVDGINFAQPAAARLAFFDFETLDVKLGPQGLTGGKNSTSGTINVITRKPTDEYAVEGDVTFGNYDSVRAKGAINVPFGERAATRLALFYQDRDGFLDNRLVSDSRDPFDVDDFGLRSHLRLNPSDSLELLFSYNYYRQNGNGPQADLVPIPRDEVPCNPTGAPEFNAGPSVMPVRARCNFELVSPFYLYRDPQGRIRGTGPVREFRSATEDPDPRATYVDFLSSQENRFWGWTTTLDWDVPEIPVAGPTQLKLLGGFQSSHQLFRQDLDGTDLLFSTNYSDRGAYQYSSELQWSGTVGERFEWQTGGLFSRESGSRFLLQPELKQVFTDLSPPPIVSPLEANLSSKLSIDQDTENKSYGVWLNGAYSATDSIRLTFGGRWSKDHKRSYMLRESEAVANANSWDWFIGCTGSLDIDYDSQGGVVPARANPWCSATYRGTMWGAGVDWHPWNSDDHLLFARVDRGHKSGGFRAGGRGEYKPESNWAYSAGSKSTFLDGRLQLNLDGFFYAYQDLQIVVLDEFVQRTENTDARMYGWDLKLTANPFEGMQLQAIVSNLHTETLDYFSLDPADVASWGGSGGAEEANPFDVAQFNERRLVVRYQHENYPPEALGGRTYATSEDCLSRPPVPSPPEQGYPCGETGDRDGLDDYSGNQLSRSPEWKITLSGEYEIPIGRFGSLTPRVQYTWNDDTYFRAFNRDFDLQEAYHLTDAKLIWISPEQRWEAEVFVTNIEDEAPIQNLFVGARSNGAPPIVWWGPPRFYGFRVGFKY